MARTPLASMLEQAASVASEATGRGVPTDQVLGERSGLTRREVLVGGAGLAVAGALSSPVTRAFAATAPRIVVVGGGLAGLTCAYRLKQAGYRADLYEASDRLGGRCWTIRGAFADGQIAEHGGELIDQGHTQVRQLAQALGLDLDNLASAEANGTEMLGYFDGAPYSFDEATRDLKAVWQKVHSDLSAASYPTLWNLSTERGRQLDAMSIGLDQQLRPGRNELEARTAARRGLQHRIRRRGVPAQAAEQTLPSPPPRGRGTAGAP